jgi:hypothetical protein
VLGLIFEPKEEEISGTWNILCNQGPYNWDFLPSVIRMYKSRIIRRLEP